MRRRHGGVGREHRDEADVDVEDGPGRAPAPGGDLGDVGEEEGVEAVQGRQGHAGDLGEGRGDHAEPHRRRHRGQGEDVGGEARQRDFFEDVGDQRRGREGRGDRDRDALGQGAAPGDRGRPAGRGQTIAIRGSGRRAGGCRGRRRSSAASRRRPPLRGRSPRSRPRQAQGVEARRPAARQRRQEAGDAHHARPAGSRGPTRPAGRRSAIRAITQTRRSRSGMPKARQDRHRQEGEQGHVLARSPRSDG